MLIRKSRDDVSDSVGIDQSIRYQRSGSTRVFDWVVEVGQDLTGVSSVSRLHVHVLRCYFGSDIFLYRDKLDACRRGKGYTDAGNTRLSTYRTSNIPVKYCSVSRRSDCFCRATPSQISQSNIARLVDELIAFAGQPPLL